ncbi:MAG: branched-chain-amino-acid transaminase [Phycisphaerales bacterium]
MPPTAWLNGHTLDLDDARVSAFDAGFQHAVGLFETMHATRGRVFRVERHLARLERSARELGLTERLRTRALEEAIQHTLEASSLASGDDHARVKLVITGGDLNLRTTPADPGARMGAQDPTILITVTPQTPYPDEMFTRGVGVLIASYKANPFDQTAGHKTLNYWQRLRALQDAASAGMGETLVLAVTNHVCSGAVSNLFIVKDGALLTPLAHTEEQPGALAHPVLPGITRAAVIEAAQREGLAVTRRLVTIDDVLDADELFLTNSGWGVLPVVRVEKKDIGAGTPGAVTTTLRKRWAEMLTHEG